jgi:hypothetical protein
VPPGEAAANVTQLVEYATSAAGETPESFEEWLANIGCAVTHAVFFNGVRFDGSQKINMILLSENDDHACIIRDAKQTMPKAVNYYYTTREWLRERAGDSTHLQLPQWLIGSLCAEHVVLSRPTGMGDVPERDSAFQVLLLPIQVRFLDHADDHIADLLVADVYASETSRLPGENSMMKALPDFKREMALCGISDKEMMNLAIRSMERRCVKSEARPGVLRALEAYR